jgi:hypothetical protein
MSSDETYTLIQGSLAEDLSGNNAEELDDGFEFPGSSTPYVANSIDGIAVINGVTVKMLDDEDLPAGTYTVSSGSTIIYQFDWDGVNTDSEAAEASITTHTVEATTWENNAEVAILDEDEIEVTFDAFFTFVEGQEFTFEVDVDADADVNDTVAFSSFSEDFDGIVDELTIGDYTTDTKKLEVDGLDAGDDETVAVYNGGTLLTEGDDEDYTVKGDVITFAVDVAKNNIKVVVLDGDVPQHASDNSAAVDPDAE